jgi:hypothetical protein
VGCALLVAAQNMPQVWVLREYAVERKNRATGNAKYDADALFEERFADYFTTGEVLGHIGFLNYLSAEFSALPSFGLWAANNWPINSWLLFILDQVQSHNYISGKKKSRPRKGRDLHPAVPPSIARCSISLEYLTTQ